MASLKIRETKKNYYYEEKEKIRRSDGRMIIRAGENKPMLKPFLKYLPSLIFKRV